MAELNKSQQRVYNLVTTERRSVFFTGDAGTGKSFLLRRIIDALRLVSCTFVTASTGIAACNIGGTTVHSFAGVGIATDPKEALAEKVARDARAASRWRRCNTLIIDEISMIDADLFDKLEFVARHVRRSSLPFGGIRLVLCGDFFQLPPVFKRSSPSTNRFCFQSEQWEKCVPTCVVLDEIYRQKNEEFIAMLREIRRGIVSPKTEHILSTLTPIGKDTDTYTQLRSRNDECDAINRSKLAALDGDMKEFHAKEWHLPGEDQTMNMLRNNCQAPCLLQLRVHAQVILLKNLEVASGLSNGSRGVVCGFSASSLPIIRFSNHMEKEIEPAEFVIEREGRKIASLVQLPLKLAWALSIHKSQGMTIPMLCVCLSGVFEFGQAYVALSRATDLSSLSVTNFSPSVVRAHPSVIQFYDSISDSSST